MQTARLDFAQPENVRSAIAEGQRAKLIPRNDYKTVNPYSAVNPDALSDGDESGKGTGIYLDVVNGGSSIDILERKNSIKVNEFQPNKPYTTPSA
jgi:hypothetical protein